MTQPTPLFDQLGGEPVVRRLVDQFYDLMDTWPHVSELRTLHPSSLGGSRDKLFWFLCGWLGGPQLFVQRFGHPQLRARHLPFSIGVLERDQWMLCMRQALLDVVTDHEIRQLLDGSLNRLADHMRNQSED